MSDQQRGAWEDWWTQDLHQQAAVAAAANAHHNPNSSNLFGYKMAAPGFQNPATTVSSSYDYRMPTASNHAAAAAAVAATQWWYPPAANMANMQNMQNIPSPQLVSRSRMPRVTKSDAKPRGRMTAYAFFVQICREEHKKKHPEENVVFSEFSKKCAERWKTMSDKEKKRFHEMADKDKKRYDTEMQSYVPPKGEKQRGKKRKHIKDPNAPKRSLSAFFWFCNDERSKVKGANPEFGVGDIAKELGRRWANADSQTKLKYEAMAEKDKARYEREMSEYKKKPKGIMPPTMPVSTLKKVENENDDGEGDEDDEEEEDE